jgi:hypothetical protein
MYKILTFKFVLIPVLLALMKLYALAAILKTLETSIIMENVNVKRDIMMAVLKYATNARYHVNHVMADPRLNVSVVPLLIKS